ncbi:MAG: hypothetical protein IJ125_06135 [Atopobiaceae bacterium]|nr:hypothetical protein [Atopobiaceae bacterium]
MANTPKDKTQLKRMKRAASILCYVVLVSFLLTTLLATQNTALATQEKLITAPDEYSTGYESEYAAKETASGTKQNEFSPEQANNDVTVIETEQPSSDKLLETAHTADSTTEEDSHVFAEQTERDTNIAEDRQPELMSCVVRSVPSMRV